MGAAGSRLARSATFVLVALAAMTTACATSRTVDRAADAAATTEPAPTTTTTPVTTSIATTTSAPRTAPTTSKPRPAPARTTAPPAPTTTTTEPPIDPQLGRVVTLRDKGIYAVDVSSGAWLRVADSGPFDVAGDRLLTAVGMSIFSSALDGSGRRELFRLDGAEKIDWFETARDGTSYVHLSAPHPVAGTGAAWDVSGRLVGPEGEVRSANPPIGEVEWSSDGSVLVVDDFSGVHGLRASGATAWGPIAKPETIMQGGLRVSPDGKLVLGRFGGDAVQLLDVANRAWRDTPLMGDATFGPGGDAFGWPDPIPPRNGVSSAAPIVRWSPSTGARTAFVDSGQEPSWSPDGKYLACQDTPIFGSGPDQHASLRIRDAAGTPRLTITSPEHEFGRDTMFHGVGATPVVLGPRWSRDGRILVVGVW